MKTSETLAKAADYIGVHGHTTGAFYRRGAVCARGAINAVLYGNADDCGYGDCGESFDGGAEQVTRALAVHLGIEKPDPAEDGYAYLISAIGRWNDALTAEQVIVAMRACAAELAERGR